ncbi:hypothetical protein [Cupriavidus sp. IDO]|uniref:hypothetical protein n=1 Tax=Cupriavidus sp. IDO TaxID=1539142 RepID=UPI0005794B6D|nr:hypothetical protein [Cupriavidus sp. IDO]KWR90553.1 hypothetical protein RM96_08945 [Cupriavidus sp. IDO]
MKHTLASAALVLGTAFGLPAFAQQAPASPNAPNPSAQPGDSAGTTRNAPATGDMGAMSDSDHKAMSKSKSAKQPSSPARHKKPREQGAPPAPTADAPSGPKGDSPDPAPKY